MEYSLVTYSIIAITCLISYLGFSNNKLIDQLIFYPYEIKNNNSYYKFISHGFIHADGQHLLFNMITLYFFGTHLESLFYQLFGNSYVYPIFYIAAFIFSSVPSYFKQKNNAQYRSLGASGAIAAVLFATIIFDPWSSIYVVFIKMPAILFAVGYIAYSAYMDKRGGDNIGHDAHLWGAVFGFLCPLVLQPQLLSFFIEQLKHPHF